MTASAKPSRHFPRQAVERGTFPRHIDRDGNGHYAVGGIVPVGPPAEPDPWAWWRELSAERRFAVEVRLAEAATGADGVDKFDTGSDLDRLRKTLRKVAP